jgi:hypothetical protein
MLVKKKVLHLNGPSYRPNLLLFYEMNEPTNHLSCPHVLPRRKRREEKKLKGHMNQRRKYIWGASYIQANKSERKDGKNLSGDVKHKPSIYTQVHVPSLFFGCLTDSF